MRPAGPLARNPTKVPGTQLQRFGLMMRQREYLQQMKEAEYKNFLREQFVALLKEQTKQAEQLQGMMRDLSREDVPEIGKKLYDPQPLVRWLAIQVVAKHWLPLESDLVELLADRDPHVKMAAYQALVRLSRGTDLGPPPNASSKQIAQAQRYWQQWLDVQTRMPESGVEQKQAAP
jgi:hypothetical protein